MNKVFGISVVICTWNRSASLRDTLTSLNDQVVNDLLNVEVIVVDNNSTDNTRQVIDEVSLTWNLGELRYAFEACQGKQFALNTGIKISQYDLLAFTDDDILFPSNWMHNIACLFHDATLDLAGGITQIVWSEAGQPIWYDSSMLAILAGVNLGENPLDPPPLGYAPAGSNMIARRSLFERVGLFSEGHFRHMDYEFGLRCSNAQVHIAYDPSLIVYAPVDEACLTKRYFRRWSFKAGITDDSSLDSKVNTLFSVPLWMFKQVINDCVFLCVACFRLPNNASVFKRELRLWHNLGFIISRWYIKLNPKYYVKWVEKYSQKTKNLY